MPPAASQVHVGSAGGDGERLVADQRHQQAGAEEQRRRQPAVAAGGDGQHADRAGDHARASPAPPVTRSASAAPPKMATTGP